MKLKRLGIGLVLAAFGTAALSQIECSWVWFPSWCVTDNHNCTPSEYGPTTFQCNLTGMYCCQCATCTVTCTNGTKYKERSRTQVPLAQCTSAQTCDG